MNDTWSAFCNSRIELQASGSGRLDATAFAVKDVFDIKDHVTGAGSPEWKRSHPPAECNADAIDKLLQQGAALTGVTHTDELMFSLNGENYHYGTPINPNAVQHIPGGSSSGSAVAVAAGMVDFALGTDTGGSVRIPASYCGVYGFRPTHGRISLQGVVPLAPMFDTVGWMARSPQLLSDVGQVLLQGAKDEEAGFRRLLLAEDMLALADPAYQETLAPLIRQVGEMTAVSESITVADEGLDEWMRVFRTLQGAQIWATHRSWIRQIRPRFGPGIEERFQWSSTLEHADTREERLKRDELKERLSLQLGDDSVIITPTAAGAAPLRNTKGERIEEQRARMLRLCCVAGVAGLPQITLPWAQIQGLPIGLSLIAGPGQDIRLLQWANRITQALSKW